MKRRDVFAAAHDRKDYNRVAALHEMDIDEDAYRSTVTVDEQMDFYESVVEFRREFDRVKRVDTVAVPNEELLHERRNFCRNGWQLLITG